MELIPAIDLLDGHCVRLLHGDFTQCQVYEAEPDALARAYAEAGTQWLHVVDLAASRDGDSADTRSLFELLSKAPQHVQTGGGVRQAGDIEARLDAGARRVVVGSVAAAQPDRFTRWLERFGPEALVAALDVQFDEEGTPRVRSHGWTRDTGRSLWQLLNYYTERGLRHALVTDIERDGALSGPNLGLYQSMARGFPDLQFQASGGIRSIEDLQVLAATGAAAAISGKALLEGCFGIEAALEVLDAG